MKVPVLVQGDVLIATIQEALGDEDLTNLRNEIVGMVGKRRAKAVILDVSAIEMLDSFATRTLRDTAQAARLRGARTIIVGIPPEVAFAMVELGLTLSSVETALDLDGAMSELTHG